MLLRNESKLIFSASIDLIFDDETEIHELVTEGDVLELTYRQNSNKMNNTGRLVKIIPIIHRTPIHKIEQCHCHYNENPSVKLVMDFSTDKKSDVQEILITDIIMVKNIIIDDEDDNIDEIPDPNEDDQQIIPDPDNSEDDSNEDDNIDETPDPNEDDEDDSED